MRSLQTSDGPLERQSLVGIPWHDRDRKLDRRKKNGPARGATIAERTKRVWTRRRGYTRFIVNAVSCEQVDPCGTVGLDLGLPSGTEMRVKLGDGRAIEWRGSTTDASHKRVIIERPSLFDLGLRVHEELRNCWSVNILAIRCTDAVDYPRKREALLGIPRSHGDV